MEHFEAARFRGGREEGSSVCGDVFFAIAEGVSEQDEPAREHGWTGEECDVPEADHGEERENGEEGVSVGTNVDGVLLAVFFVCFCEAEAEQPGEGLLDDLRG